MTLCVHKISIFDNVHAPKGKNEGEGHAWEVQGREGGSQERAQDGIKHCNAKHRD